MAFAFALPAIGSAVLPAVTAIGSGLGAAASGIGGALASGAGALGGAIGSLPGLSSVGGAIGSLGSGLGGSIGALGAGNLGGALSSLGSGVLGAGANALGGLGSLYTGADKIVGGLLPNIGSAGIAPSQGYLGALFKPQGANQVGYGTVLAPPEGGFPQLAPGNDGGFFGMGKGGGILGGAEDILGKAAGLAKIAQPFFGGMAGGTPPGVTQSTIGTRQVMPGETNKPILLGGGQSPQNTSLNLGGPPTSYMNLPQNFQGQGPSYNNRLEEIESAVESLMGEGGGAPFQKSPQQRSLEMMYGRPSSMVA